MAIQAKRIIKFVVQITSLLSRFSTPSSWQKAGTFAAIVLLTVASVWAAQITWLILTPQVSVGAPHTSVAVGAGTATRADVTQLQALHLFGEAGAVASNRVVQDAPETTLNIRLVGVTASTNPLLSAAIIQQGSNQATYIPGDTIQGSRAVLKEIYSDRVLLENNNRTETLWLDGRDGSEASLELNVASRQETRNESSGARAEEPAEVMADLSSDQLEVLEVIAIQPERNEDGLVGYRVSPKSDQALFRELGFENGDIAVAINGYDLTNMAEAMELMNELQGMTEAQVRVLRNGEFVDIDIYLPNE
ncbi:MAG: type 2a secretion system assembly platform protein GspC [Idiomarinaceae bacterium HL-53]|nr:MAG: type 2a secretion system assembly platform protein GspC [Idiomarinaceae bacterium HL-53]CUS47261.1 type II secretion system protein C (GspC) [Idiomarinaceae bacterium HL-53]